MERKIVSIALQGGGTHLAFSWGVLDALLEDGRLNFEGGSGTSAGGLSCAALAQGLMKNGNQGGREELRAFWQFINQQGISLGLIPTLADKILSSEGVEFSPVLRIINFLLVNQLSPYQWNPYGLVTFRKLLNDFFEIEKLSRYKDFKLFLTATNVRNSKLKIFTENELTVDAFMASCCVPLMSEAIEIKGESYWDGGYIGNPSLFPLIYNCKSSDIIIILVVPHHIEHTPMTYKEIRERMLELFHINTLTREMRSIEYITDLINKGIADPSKLKKVNIHVIEDHTFFTNLDPTSAMNTSWDFIMMLYERGYAQGTAWLEQNYQYIGNKSSVNIKEDFV